MALPPKKEQKLWVIKVVTYPDGELVGLVLGDRSADTLKPLVQSLDEAHSPVLYCTDEWQAFSQVIPEKRLVQSQALTPTIESHNAMLRHWIGRFRRATRIVSRSAKAVAESIVLAEHLHRRNGLESLKALYAPLFG